MLNDRERMILHLCCSITIAKMSDVSNYKDMLETLIEDIRKNRCRSLSDGEISSLLEDINEEMFAGSNMFRHLTDESQHPSICLTDLTDEEIWAMTGERPNRKMNGAERWK